MAPARAACVCVESWGYWKGGAPLGAPSAANSGPMELGDGPGAGGVEWSWSCPRAVPTEALRMASCPWGVAGSGTVELENSPCFGRARCGLERGLIRFVYGEFWLSCGITLL